MRFQPIFVLLILALAACAPTIAPIENLPPGDVTRGAQLFTQSVNGAPACSTCHTLDGTSLVGPSLHGYGAVAPTRVTDTSAETYTHVSIVQPAAYLVGGFGNNMYNQYARHLTPQEIADLIAYLLTL